MESQETCKPLTDEEWVEVIRLSAALPVSAKKRIQLVKIAVDYIMKEAA